MIARRCRSSITGDPTRHWTDSNHINLLQSLCMNSPYFLRIRIVTVTSFCLAVLFNLSIPFFVVAFISAGHAAPGDLDPIFGSGGTVITSYTTIKGNFPFVGRSVALQGDGKIVVAGGLLVAGNYYPAIALVRYDSNGSLDSNFGNGGKLTDPPGSGQSVALQSDGKIVVAGDNGAYFLVVRYMSNGIPDNSFENGGRAITPMGNHDTGYSVAIQTDGKIVVAGSWYSGISPYDFFALVRYNSNGSLDGTFGSGGKVATSIPGIVYSTAIQDDGKIVVAGYLYNGGHPCFGLARFNANGSLDTTFNNTGTVGTTFAGQANDDRGRGVAIQSDGKIVVAGYAKLVNTMYFALARYNSNGSLDTAFNGSGKITTGFAQGYNSQGYGVAIQHDNKIVVAGYSQTNTGLQFALARHNADGRLDTSLNGAGKVMTSFGNTSPQGYSIAIQGDDKIVVAGKTGPDSGASFAVARYLGGPFPLVFVPGIAGSMLTGNGETGANGNGEYLWPTLGAQDIRAMNLHSPVTDVQAVGIVREYDPGIGGIGTKIVYQPLMDYLVNRLGYVEFDLQERPERMTNGYLQHQSWAQKPTLFTFPYDWRKANSSHAVKLRDYIEQISQLHGGAKVDVIAHSMGGLVLRQYLQTYGTEKIDKVVTIGTPVWGSPKVVYRMLTGEFYDSLIDWDTSTDMKAALRSMPSTAELIPPFQPGHISGRTTLLSEDHRDLNKAGGANEIYTPSIFWKYIDSIAPGFQTINTTLHTALQDNWHGDNSDISYLQVYGRVMESGKFTTTTDVVAFEKNYSVLGVNIFQVHGYRENKGPGDNVVPLESADRPSQYLAPNTELFPITVDTDDAKSNPGEHTELTKNAMVHAKIATFLGLTPTPAPPPPAAPLPPPPSSGNRRSVTLFGSGYVPIADTAGNQNTRLTDAAIKKIPGLNIQYHGDEGWIEIEGDASKEFTITSPAVTGELEAQIVTYNAAGTADSLTRYRFAPSAQGWRLSAPSGASQLAVDANQNGIFEAGEAVTPSHQVTGAVDMTPPSLTMTLGLQAGALSVTMAGSDNAGNPVIRYTINGGPVQVYSVPLAFTLNEQTELRAFAEDSTGNSTGLIQTAVNPRLGITRSGGAGISLSWPVADAYALEESLSLAGPWTPVTASIVRAEFSDSVFILFAGDLKKFFRLRSQTVTK